MKMPIGARIGLPCFALAAALACVTLPEDDPNKSEAIGTVTISTPLFTPIDDVTVDSKRLDFGDLRDEKNLATALQQPSFGASRIDTSSLAIQLAVALARPELSDVTTTHTDDTGTTTDRTKTRTEESPDTPALPGVPTLRQAIETAMVALLQKSDTAYRLSPDEVATLIAANQTYMVNLEEYYNVESFDFVRGMERAYLPYKMHFTVSCDPGWYTRNERSDAVVDLKFGQQQGGTEPEILILTTSPLETAQAMTEFSATWREVALALEAEGGSTNAGLKGKVERLLASAERLEGLRAERTLTVSFPADGALRVRFQPQVTASETRRDLGRVSRVLTALVLIKRESTDQTSLSVADAFEQASRSVAGEKEQLKKAEAAFIASVGTDDPEALNRLTPAQARALSALQQDEEQLKQFETQAFEQAAKSISERRAAFTTAGSFVPSVWNHDGEWSPPRSFLWWDTRSSEVLIVGGGAERTALIPPWIGDLDRSLEIVSAAGYYRFEQADVRAAMTKLSRLDAELAVLKKELEAKEKARSESSPPEAGQKKNQELLQKQLAEAKTEPEKERLREELRKVEVELAKLGDAAALAKKAADDKKSDVDKKAGEVEAARLHLETEFAAALKNTTVTVRIDVVGPRYASTGDSLRTVLPSATWGRILGLGIDGSSVPYASLGRGSLSSVLEASQIDLAMAVKLGDKPELAPVRALVEVALTAEGESPGSATTLRACTKEIQLQPFLGTAEAAAKPSSADPKTSASPGAITLDLSGMKFVLEGAPKAASDGKKDAAVPEPKKDGGS
jgi:hypothetical protein